MLFGKQAIKKWGEIPKAKNVSHELLQAFGFSSDSYNESSWLGDSQILFFFFCKDVKAFQKPWV